MRYESTQDLTDHFQAVVIQARRHARRHQWEGNAHQPESAVIVANEAGCGLLSMYKFHVFDPQTISRWTSLARSSLFSQLYRRHYTPPSNTASKICCYSSKF